MKKILYVGETWVKNITHIKGYDTFVTCHYEDCSQFLADAIKGRGYKVHHIPAHMAGESFPKTVEELSAYDAVVLSDIGSNSFYLTNSVFLEGKSCSNPLQALKDYILEGGGLLMVGGYMSFTGIDAKARYASTPLADVLPVEMMSMDDRRELPQGVVPEVVKPKHPVLGSIGGAWKPLLGYNILASKKGCEVLVTLNGTDVCLAVGEFGKGRSAAFASDCAPHWGTLEFMNWEHYNTLWGNIAAWLVKEL